MYKITLVVTGNEAAQTANVHWRVETGTEGKMVGGGKLNQIVTNVSEAPAGIGRDLALKVRECLQQYLF